jgi:hypothetical protein
MEQEKTELTAEQAVEFGFDYFEKFVARDKYLNNVLLEGLEPNGDGWIVSIGFNGLRQETSEPVSPGSMAAFGGYGSKTTKTVREVRHIHLDSQGQFEKITA